MTDLKIKAIDDKIKSLKEQKTKIEKKRTEAALKIFTRLGLAEWDLEIVAGALVSLSQASQDNQKLEGWRQTGKTFLSQSKRKTT